MTEARVVYGDMEVPILQRPWRSIPDLPGFRSIHLMKPGEMWADLTWDERFFEHLADVDGAPIPVGIAIARELLADGADWAFLTDVWHGKLVLLDADGRRAANEGPVAEVLALLFAANGGRYGALPDSIGGRAGKVILREAKRRGRDHLGVTQHAFARAAARVLGGRLDLAVVEWDVSS